MPPKKPLALKEQTLFKELLTLYENRHLKKALKTADAILKKSPDNGETQCMKGLIMTHMGLRKEGIDLVKKGMRNDLTSHICWHVFGLIQKGEKNYEEALKSYMQALRFDKENVNLLQDAANLQSQLRLFESLQDTREAILRHRPQYRRHWIGLAVAYHLNGNLAGAKKILESYEMMLKNVPDYDVEHSEVLLYHVRILEEAGDFGEALSLLDSNAKSRAIVNRTAIMEFRARLLAKLGNPTEAEQTWRSLIDRNTDCYDYYRQLLQLQGTPLDAVTDENRAQILSTLLTLSDQHPRSHTPLRLALDVAEGDVFRERARRYILDHLRRGIPSLFVDLKSLYSSPFKQDVIEAIAKELQSSYMPTSANYDTSESPTTYIWTLYLLAQHYSYLRRFDLALATLDDAIKHTPTLPELFTCKGRVLKRAGDLVGAVRCIEKARELDGQDRFLNTKSAKYHLRAGLSEEASSIFGLFTKKDATSPGADLEEMQSMLYLVEEGNCQTRLGRLGLALKKYTSVQNVFDDICNDQYDFHSYSIRHFMLDAYVNLIKWEDQLRTHPAYVESALQAARIYVRVHDDPSLIASASIPARTEAEKKAQKKARKAAAIKSLEEAKKASAIISPNDDKGLEPPTPKDEDPDGTKALSDAEGLNKAWKFLKPLVAPERTPTIDVHICVYDVSIRREKYLQATKSLLAAQALDPEDPELHVRVVHFRQRLSSLPQQPTQPMESIVSTSLAKLLPPELALDTFNSQYLQRHSTSGKALVAAAQVLHMLSAPLTEIESTVFGLFNPDLDIDIKTALGAFELLRRLKSSRSDEFRVACDKAFVVSTIFKTKEELDGIARHTCYDPSELPGDKEENST